MIQLSMCISKLSSSLHERFLFTYHLNTALSIYLSFLLKEITALLPLTPLLSVFKGNLPCIGWQGLRTFSSYHLLIIKPFSTRIWETVLAFPFPINSVKKPAKLKTLTLYPKDSTRGYFNLKIPLLSFTRRIWVFKP